jgi:hypothetical protein
MNKKTNKKYKRQKTKENKEIFYCNKIEPLLALPTTTLRR